MKCYAVKKFGSYLNDLHLKGGTKNGTYHATFTPEDEIDTKNDIWITENYYHAQGAALLVDGIVVKYE